ncbi:peptidoglycan DD-metalloendopeptidase family protein [Thalassotalea sp. PLHSN55]|uniref:peptidoglycan DD-metalloendopeptidase family protein n=1 Tax=Thalassotalea sp. PLHSN55 TaxID=3435888 RepID=UPI003F86096F
MTYTWLHKNIGKYWLVTLVTLLSACSSRHAPAPVVEGQGSVPLSQRVKSSITGTEYFVKKGETLFSIAWRSNTDIRHIASLNNLAPPYRIFPGQKLILAKKTSQPSKNKRSSESLQIEQQKVVKKPVAQNKKQAYGGNVSEQKTSDKSPTKSNSSTNFSQKISRWQWPVKGRVIANFSSSQQGNKGIDIAGNRGDSIRAAASGKVVYAGSALRGYGKLIIIKHNDDYLSAYAHNDALLVKEQQTIKAGQVIAKMGDTGAQRVMLHFEVRFRGKPVNPRKYLPK